LTTTSTRAAAPLPSDEAAEQAVLGAMLTNENAVAIAQDLLEADDYYLPQHQKIHEAILAAFSADTPIDSVLIGSACGHEYVSLLCDAVPSAANVGYYAKIVKDHSRARALVRVGHEIVELGTKRPHDVKVLIDQAEQMVFGLEPPQSKYTSTILEVADRVVRDVEEKVPPVRWRTGFRVVDDVLGGLYAGHLIIIGARPGLGKTALALNFAHSVAQQGPVLFYSLEMSGEELAERYICMLARVNLRSLREHRVDDDKLADVINTLTAAEKSQLTLVSDPGLTLTSLKAQARRMNAKKKLALIVVDYLQLLTIGAKIDNRQSEVATISRDLKILARTLEVPIIALSQLNRENESHWSDGKPKLSQLRESGAIEQDADEVLLLSWPKDRHGEVVVDVKKNRHGPLEEVTLEWTPQYMKFSDKV
jgi:replicative DNA helicase